MAALTRLRAFGLIALLAVGAALSSALLSGPAVAAPPTPAPTPTPSATLSPAPSTVSPPESDCGFIDVACKTRQAVDEWFTHLVESATKPVFEMLGSTVLATPELDSPQMARAKQLWELSRTIANTCFVLLVTIAGVMLMVGQALPGGISARELLPRLVWAFLAANLSLIAIKYAITLANGLSQAFLADGADRIDPELVFDAIKKAVLTGIILKGVFFAIVALVVVVLAVGVLSTYIVRLALTMVVIVAAPLALILHALPMTEGLARLWWRAFTGLLAIQMCQSLVLVAALQLMFSANPADDDSFWIPSTADMTDLLMAICLLFVLLKIPGWVARTIWQASKPRTLSRLVKSLIVYRGLGMLLGKGFSAARAARRPKPPKPPSPPNGGGGGPSGPPGGGPGGGPGRRGPNAGGPRTGRPRAPRRPPGMAASGRPGGGSTGVHRSSPGGRPARPHGPGNGVGNPLAPVDPPQPQPVRLHRPVVRRDRPPNGAVPFESPTVRRSSRRPAQVALRLLTPRSQGKAARRAPRK
ncbi:hypothetical protein MF672_009515 [Actinomadura sp. ATCC 31491]|uniref:TrbL/VirB6 plasmid conjugal transfer protein n=1 Tax=Actinomadura luzonensis TaxID=2805427 RepID=A0ABT0FNV5_9ACTN|nr:hypothetical protein [Actinomadura luzonensis]MCK2214024.1 hypothetical protein [Actinomadura luzonensis]